MKKAQARPMRSQRFEWAAALGVAVCGVILRLGYVWLSGTWRHVELFEWETIADQLLAGRGFLIEHHGTWYRSFGSPPFAFLCAAVYAMFHHSHLAMLIVQACVSAVTILGCYALGRRMASPGAGLIAAALVALHPGLFYYDTHKLHPLGLDAALAVIGLLALVRLRERTGPRSGLAAGVVHGLALFERSTQIGLAALSAWSLWRMADRRRAWRAAAAYALAVSAVLAPWVVRNLHVYGRPILITTTGAEVLWMGNNADASGGAFAQGQPGVPVFDAAPAAWRAQVTGQDEFTQRRLFRDAALTYMRRQPAVTLRLYAEKLFAFGWFGPQSGLLYPPAYRVAYTAYYAVILLLGLAGLWAARQETDTRHRQVQTQLLIFLASVALLQAVFYVEVRHRWGIEPLWLVVAGAGVVRTATWLRPLAGFAPSAAHAKISSSEAHDVV